MNELKDEPFSQLKVGKLTPEILFTFPGCKNYTYEEAVNIVVSLEKLAEIIYKIESKGNERLG